MIFRRKQEAAVKALKDKRRQELVDLLERTEAGEHELTNFKLLDAHNFVPVINNKPLQQYAYYLSDLLTEEEQKRWEILAAKASLEREYVRLLKVMRYALSHLEQALNASTEINALEAFLNHAACRDERLLERIQTALGVNIKDMRNELKTLVLARYEQLLSSSEDRQAFIELRELIEHTQQRRYFSTNVRDLGVEPLAYPENWNDLVAIHYKAPAYDDFINLEDLTHAEVRILAATAIGTDNFTVAQIALAYCNHNVATRQAVGDVLTADLAIMVSRHKVALIKRFLNLET